MAIDLERAMYSHCEHAADVLPIHLSVLLERSLEDLIGAPIRMTRQVTYLQGAIADLTYEAEFRLHVWVDLPEGHPTFDHADRGLACLVRPITAEGLLGATLGGVGWLGRPLGPWADLSGGDWVTQMIEEQGYLSIPGAEWLQEVTDVSTQALLGMMLGHHLRGMTNHVILEEQLYGR